MRHLKKGRKFGRMSAQRQALLRQLAHNLIARGRIKTTLAKAKELRPYIEKALTLAKKGRLHNRRELLSRLPTPSVRKLVTEIAPRYISRDGGYIRIMKLPSRKSDSSQMAIIELLS